MLNMSLSKIRDKIHIYPENWVNVTTTNCYAYALGLDIRESDICRSAYQPGTISGIFEPKMLENHFYDALIRCIEEDLKVLGISYRQIEPEDSLNLNEWKLALFTDNYDSVIVDDLVCDFHFLRTNKNGVWIHKPDYLGIPSKKDHSGKIITDLKACDLSFYEYKKCYALKIGKK